MTRSTITVAALTLFVVACSGDAPVAPEAVSSDTETMTLAASQAEAEPAGLPTLRAATARFHRFDAAFDAGYTHLFADMCMEGGTGSNTGGMGYHYVNFALVDGTVDAATPEALLYEPGPNGQKRLVAVEYVIPKAAWTGPGVPMLFGQELELNAFDLYALHAWVWKHNPDGLFKPWNPDVSCAHAEAVMAH